MTHISRKFLKGDAEQKLIAVLIETLSKKGNAKQRMAICKELLTGTERLMLAKRLAIICLLGEGVPFEQISKQLKVSSSTVARLWESMQQGIFKETIQSARKNKVSEYVFSIINFLLFPRQKHEPRWQWLDEFS